MGKWSYLKPSVSIQPHDVPLNLFLSFRSFSEILWFSSESFHIPLFEVISRYFITKIFLLLYFPIWYHWCKWNLLISTILILYTAYYLILFNPNNISVESVEFFSSIIKHLQMLYWFLLICWFVLVEFLPAPEMVSIILTTWCSHHYEVPFHTEPELVSVTNRI